MWLALIRCWLGGGNNRLVVGVRMNSPFCRLSLIPPVRLLLVLAVFAIAAPDLLAWQQRVAPKNLAVDVVAVHGVGRINGIILEQSPKLLKISVGRDWLRTNRPEFWKKHAAIEAQSLQSDREQMLLRMRDWREDLEGDDAAIIGDFLDDNMKLLGLDKPVDMAAFDFTIITLKKSEFGRVYSQSPQRHLLAAIAWSENFENVESTSATVLKRKIEQKKIDVDNYVLTLGDKIPLLLEADDKWEARKAIVEFALLPRLEYQGTGTVFFATRQGRESNAGTARNSAGRWFGWFTHSPVGQRPWPARVSGSWQKSGRGRVDETDDQDC